MEVDSVALYIPSAPPPEPMPSTTESTAVVQSYVPEGVGENIDILA